MIESLIIAGFFLVACINDDRGTPVKETVSISDQGTPTVVAEKITKEKAQ